MITLALALATQGFTTSRWLAADRTRSTREAKTTTTTWISTAATGSVTTVRNNLLMDSSEALPGPEDLWAIHCCMRLRAPALELNTMFCTSRYAVNVGMRP